MKPAFTDSNLNDTATHLIDSGAKDPQTAALAALARSDWRQALDLAFHLTPGQKSNLAQIPPDRVAAIQSAVIMALDTGGRITTTIGANGSVEITRGGSGALPHGGVSPELRIPILKCRFGPNCDNWQCTIGPR